MSSNNASTNDTEAHSMSPSIDRAPLMEEAAIADLQKSVAMLRKKISTEERKLQKYRDEVFHIQKEMQIKSAPGLALARKIVHELAEEVIKSCSSDTFNPKIKCHIRDVLFSAVHEFGPPEIDMPEWLTLTPPEPQSLLLLKDKGGSIKDGDSKQEAFSFLDEEEKISEPDTDRSSDPDDDSEDPFSDFFEELARQKAEEEAETFRILRGGSVKVGDEEKRSLRGLYLRLVTAVHPDLATNEEEKAERTHLAARINNAYKAGQFTVLLEIEEQLNKKKKSDDALSRYQFFVDEIKHLQEMQRLLLEQLSRVKGDFKKLKKSDIGSAHKELKKYAKNGAVSEEVLTNEVKEKAEPFISLATRLQLTNSGRNSFKTFRKWFAKSFYGFDGEELQTQDDFAEEMNALFDEAYEQFASHSRSRRRK